MFKASQLSVGRAARLGSSPSIRSRSAQWARYASNAAPRKQGGRPVVGFALIFAAGAAGAYYYPKAKELLASQGEQQQQKKAPAGPAKAEVEFEKPRKEATTKEDNRDLISSQHLQVKNSWEHPGVYVWGSNVGKVVDPDSEEKTIKLPRRLAFFDGQILRDLKLTQNFGAAITEKGDLVQWGKGFSQENPKPLTTLTGKDLTKIVVSADRIIALSKNGSVYSVPSSKDHQEGGTKREQEKSSWSLWRAVGLEPISFRNLTPSKLTRGEKITDITSGLEHCLLLSSKGRVFAAASSALDFPSKGQMGIPGLSWETRPKGPYDQPHEIEALQGFEITQIAAGDYHSVLLDKLGRVFTFGDNTYGQLGFPSDVTVQSANSPTMLNVHKLYNGSGLVPKVTSIAAGGLNTFFTADASAPAIGESARPMAPGRTMPRSVSDLWAAGQGVYGSLGTGKWTHVSAGPTKLKALSSLFEFDEKTNMMAPIKIKALSVGSNHSAAVMDNVTETSITSSSSANETNWGADVLFWGGNEHYQLGTGKRNNMNAPTYIGPLDSGEGDLEKGRMGVHRLCITPRTTVRLDGGKGRKVTMEQRVECGQYVTAVYSAV
ncbi:regulator of chromosome condensation 1/beta-lactamase-inhibitor protein II [Stachybotrys elegans]|uniref:Regulator of chromosome condensation 1/beta-lactamase-inhibitor protein II n=1 Tax=Stachybotrys elegans TaxID=80388 RepID=A0A8K0T1Q8_9HYPO|nr:regulator of chromosome condensation 1/beta-lactamase-inhibitor protein II [Stachybotrys elegans]